MAWPCTAAATTTVRALACWLAGSATICTTMICPIIATTARTAAELVNTMTQLRARGATETAPNLGNRMKRIYHTKRIAEASARYYTITPKEKPPLGLMGGSVHDYERGKDPFARECMPPEFQDRFPDKPAARERTSSGSGSTRMAHPRIRH